MQFILPWRKFFWESCELFYEKLSYYHILLTDRSWFEYSEKLLSSHLMNFGLLTVKLKDTIFPNPVLIKCSKSALPVTSSCACQLNIWENSYNLINVQVAFKDLNRVIFWFLNIKTRKLESNFTLLEIHVKISLVLELLKKHGGNVFWHARAVYAFHSLWT